jgi:hypothetical protein
VESTRASASLSHPRWLRPARCGLGTRILALALTTIRKSSVALATVLDLCSKELIGYAIAQHMRASLAIDAIATIEHSDMSSRTPLPARKCGRFHTRVRGRPGRLCRDFAAHRRVTRSRCRRRIVAGATGRCTAPWRRRGITASRAAIKARSAQETFGRAHSQSRRCRTASLHPQALMSDCMVVQPVTSYMT